MSAQCANETVFTILTVINLVFILLSIPPIIFKIFLGPEIAHGAAISHAGLDRCTIWPIIVVYSTTLLTASQSERGSSPTRQTQHVKHAVGGTHAKENKK